ncbi:hypothetical protein M0R45_008145 [Rubus argutus]|uniref:Uncharacterized protein n=1 Tax=Rubus argutus TaxID=59490 RepID=A0AAW1XZV9_RUBAR
MLISDWLNGGRSATPELNIGDVVVVATRARRSCCFEGFVVTLTIIYEILCSSIGTLQCVSIDIGLYIEDLRRLLLDDFASVVSKTIDQEVGQLLHERRLKNESSCSITSGLPFPCHTLLRQTNTGFIIIFNHCPSAKPSP